MNRSLSPSLPRLTLRFPFEERRRILVCVRSKIRAVRCTIEHDASVAQKTFLAALFVSLKISCSTQHNSISTKYDDRRCLCVDVIDVRCDEHSSANGYSLLDGVLTWHEMCSFDLFSFAATL